MQIVWGLFYINFPQSSFAVVYKYHGQLHQRGHNHVKHQICLCYTQTGQNKRSLSLQPLCDYFLFILTCMFLSTFLCYSFYLKIAFIKLLHNWKTPKMQSLSFYTMEKKPWMQHKSILIKNYTAIFFGWSKEFCHHAGLFLYSSLQFIPAFIFFLSIFGWTCFYPFLEKFEKGISMLVLIRKNVCVKS